MKSMSFHTAALLADSINDASSTRKVYLLAAGLAVLGIALVVMTVWFWRSTRHDPELLAPLEVMGARRFRRLESGAQQQALDHSRPADAKPMRWGVVRGEASTDSEIDLRESMRAAPGGFDDLRDPALIAVALESPEGDYTSTLDPDGDPVAVDPIAEIDAMLAGAGSKASPAEVEPVVAVEPQPLEQAEQTKQAEPAEVAAVVPADAPVTRTAEESPAQVPSSPRGSKPGAARGPQPLVIVPVDHELRPSAQRTEPADEPEPADDTAGTEQPEVDDEPVSIDPLLRMVNRNDG